MLTIPLNVNRSSEKNVVASNSSRWHYDASSRITPKDSRIPLRGMKQKGHPTNFHLKGGSKGKVGGWFNPNATTISKAPSRS